MAPSINNPNTNYPNPGTHDAGTQDESVSRISVRDIKPREAEAIELLLLDESSLTKIGANISTDQFVPGPARELFEIFLSCLSTENSASFQTVMTHIENPALKNILVELDERAKNKSSDTAEQVQLWTDNVIHAFDREVNEIERRQTLASLDQSQLSYQEELDALQLIIQQKKKQHELNQHGVPAPTDG